MAKECFCGCGRKVPRRAVLGAGPVNTRGRQVRDRLHKMEYEYGIPRDVDDDTAAWYAEGDEIVADLAAVVHGELRPRDVDERWVREWQAVGRQAERSYLARMGKIGRAARERGLSDEEAAQALARGELPLD
jgi:hypothetical protein